MKKILTTLVIALSASALSTQALADGVRGYPHRHHQELRSRSADWLGPLLVLGIASSAISAAANSPSYAPQPQVVYTPAPVTYAPPPPASAGYFCSSVGQFYPNTTYCPEGWQMVTVR